MKLKLTSVLLAGIGAGSVALAQVPTVPETGEGEESVVMEQAAVAPIAAEAVALADCVAAVHDAATADAAAARVAELVPKLAEQGGEETFWTRLHMAYADCYGSEALRQAIAPLLPPADTASNPDFRHSLPLLNDILQTLDDICATLSSVQDKASANAAAEALALFATHIDDCMRDGDAVPAPQGNRIDLVIYYYSGEYRRTAAVFKAWGELQNRSGDYYGSEELAKAMESLSAAMENLDQPADPYAIGQMVEVCPQMEDVLCRWLDIAAGVHDEATADAAAGKLRACADELNDLVSNLGQGYEKDLGHVSPRFLFLTLACDRFVQFFIRQGCFGSAALQESVEP